MSEAIVWTIESLDHSEICGTFSTKGKALEAIRLWSNARHKYKILTDIKKIKRKNKTPEFVYIQFQENERLVTLWIRYYYLNNGSGMCHIFHKHFGNTDENESKENNK
jgi:hypothetical protein